MKRSLFVKSVTWFFAIVLVRRSIKYGKSEAFSAYFTFLNRKRSKCCSRKKKTIGPVGRGCVGRTSVPRVVCKISFWKILISKIHVLKGIRSWWKKMKVSIDTQPNTTTHEVTEKLNLSNPSIHDQVKANRLLFWLKKRKKSQMTFGATHFPSTLFGFCVRFLISYWWWSRAMNWDFATSHIVFRQLINIHC